MRVRLQVYLFVCAILCAQLNYSESQSENVIIKCVNDGDCPDDGSCVLSTAGRHQCMCNTGFVQNDITSEGNVMTVCIGR